MNLINRISIQPWVKQVATCILMLINVLFFSNLYGIENTDSLIQAIESSTNQSEKLKLKENLSTLYFSTAAYTKALKVNIELLEYAEEQKDSANLGKRYLEVGRAHYFFRTDSSNQICFPFLLKAHKISTLTGDTMTMYRSARGIGVVYGEQTHENMDSSLYYLNKAIDLALKQKLYSHAMETYIIISSYYLRPLKDTTRALNTLKTAEKLINKADNSQSVAYLYRTMANLYLAKKNYKKAEHFLMQALELYNKSNNKDGLINTYSSLSNTYYNANKFEQAYDALKQYSQLRYDVYNETTAKSLAEMKTKYETAKKEKENIELQNKAKIQSLKIESISTRNNLLLVSCLLIAVIGISIIIYVKNKQKITLANIKMEQEKEQINAIIDAEEKERMRIAKELHDGLGQLLSTAKINVSGLEDNITEQDKFLLDNSLQLIDDAVHEVRNISHNMMPVALMKYGLIPAVKELATKINDTKQISVDFIHDENLKIEQSKEIGIFRIIQEVLNNMLKHAEASKINIKLTQNDKGLNLQINDNGIGFDINEIENSSGIGWKNIYSRALLLKGKINLNSTKGQGTAVNIEFST